MSRSDNSKHSRRYKNQLIFIALSEAYPKSFTLQPKKPRIIWPDSIKDIDMSLLPFSESEIKSAVRYYINTPRYLKSIVSSSWYRDIHGNRVAMITNWVKVEAQLRLDNLTEKKEPTITYKKSSV